MEVRHDADAGIGGVFLSTAAFSCTVDDRTTFVLRASNTSSTCLVQLLVTSGCAIDTAEWQLPEPVFSSDSIIKLASTDFSSNTFRLAYASVSGSLFSIEISLSAGGSKFSAPSYTPISVAPVGTGIPAAIACAGPQLASLILDGGGKVHSLEDEPASVDVPAPAVATVPAAADVGAADAMDEDAAPAGVNGSSGGIFSSVWGGIKSLVGLAGTSNGPASDASAAAALAKRDAEAARLAAAVAPVAVALAPGRDHEHSLLFVLHASGRLVVHDVGFNPGFTSIANEVHLSELIAPLASTGLVDAGFVAAASAAVDDVVASKPFLAAPSSSSAQSSSSQSDCRLIALPHTDEILHVLLHARLAPELGVSAPITVRIRYSIDDGTLAGVAAVVAHASCATATNLPHTTAAPPWCRGNGMSLVSACYAHVPSTADSLQQQRHQQRQKVLYTLWRNRRPVKPVHVDAAGASDNVEMCENSTSNGHLDPAVAAAQAWPRTTATSWVLSHTVVGSEVDGGSGDMSIAGSAGSKLVGFRSPGAVGTPRSGSRSPSASASSQQSSSSQHPVLFTRLVTATEMIPVSGNNSLGDDGIKDGSSTKRARLMRAADNQQDPLLLWSSGSTAGLPLPMVIRSQPSSHSIIVPMLPAPPHKTPNLATLLQAPAQEYLAAALQGAQRNAASAPGGLFDLLDPHFTASLAQPMRAAAPQQQQSQAAAFTTAGAVVWCAQALLQLLPADARADLLASTIADDNSGASGPDAPVRVNELVTLESTRINRPAGAGQTLPKLDGGASSSSSTAKSNQLHSRRQSDDQYAAASSMLRSMLANMRTQLRTHLSAALQSAWPPASASSTSAQADTAASGYDSMSESLAGLVNAGMLPEGCDLDVAGLAECATNPPSLVLYQLQLLGTLLQSPAGWLCVERILGASAVDADAESLLPLSVSSATHYDVPSIVRALGPAAAPVIAALLIFMEALQPSMSGPPAVSTPLIEALQQVLFARALSTSLPADHACTAPAVIVRLGLLRDTAVGIAAVAAGDSALELFAANSAVQVGRMLWLAQQRIDPTVALLVSGMHSLGNAGRHGAGLADGFTRFAQPEIKRLDDLLFSGDQSAINGVLDATITTATCGAHGSDSAPALIPLLLQSAAKRQNRGDPSIVIEPTDMLVRLSDIPEGRKLNFAGAAAASHAATVARYTAVVDSITSTLMQLRLPGIAAHWIGLIAPHTSIGSATTSATGATVGSSASEKGRDRGYLHLKGICHLSSAVVASSSGGDALSNVAAALACFRLVVADMATEVRTLLSATAGSINVTAAGRATITAPEAGRDLVCYAAGLDHTIRAAGLPMPCLQPIFKCVWEYLPSLKPALPGDEYDVLCDDIRFALFEASMPSAAPPALTSTSFGGHSSSGRFGSAVLALCPSPDPISAYRVALSISEQPRRLKTLDTLILTLSSIASTPASRIPSAVDGGTIPRAAAAEALASLPFTAEDFARAGVPQPSMQLQALNFAATSLASSRIADRSLALASTALVAQQPSSQLGAEIAAAAAMWRAVVRDAEVRHARCSVAVPPAYDAAATAAYSGAVKLASILDAASVVSGAVDSSIPIQLLSEIATARFQLLSLACQSLRVLESEGRKELGLISIVEEVPSDSGSGGEARSETTFADAADVQYAHITARCQADMLAAAAVSASVSSGPSAFTTPFARAVLGSRASLLSRARVGSTWGTNAGVQVWCIATGRFLSAAAIGRAATASAAGGDQKVTCNDADDLDASSSQMQVLSEAGVLRCLVRACTIVPVDLSIMPSESLVALCGQQWQPDFVSPALLRSITSPVIAREAEACPPDNHGEVGLASALWSALQQLVTAASSAAGNAADAAVGCAVLDKFLSSSSSSQSPSVPAWLLQSALCLPVAAVAAAVAPPIIASVHRAEDVARIFMKHGFVEAAAETLVGLAGVHAGIGRPQQGVRASVDLLQAIIIAVTASASGRRAQLSAALEALLAF